MDFFNGDNSVMIGSLSATTALAFISLGTGHLIGRTLSSVDKWIIIWLIFDALIHFLLEGPFVILSLTGTVNSSRHFSALLWKEYGKADSRWLYSDPTIVSLELLTVTLCSILCWVLIYSILTKVYYRHFVQITLCVCELYGGWMTFCPEWLIGSPSLDTSNFMFLWVYLVFFNFLWVIIPLALLYHSWKTIEKTFSLGKERQSPARQKRNQGKTRNLTSGEKKKQK